MAEFVADCPRCNASRMTFDCHASVIVGKEHSWKHYGELACICRGCGKMSVHLVSRQSPSEEVSRFFGPIKSKNTLSAFVGNLNDIVRFERHITLKDRAVESPPEHIPSVIRDVISEANQCVVMRCWNAGGAMYRLALDLATKDLLPEKDDPAPKVRRSLGLRMEWLFANGRLPPELKTLADCIKEDGNDGAHDGNLTEADAEDLHDFTYRLLDRLFSEPERLRLAAERRSARREEKE